MERKRIESEPAVFGKRPEEFRYRVVVCPRCQEHAQITDADKKTLGCQHCGARLQVRKLRVFYSSDELAEAVEFRTKLQAKLSENGNRKPFSEDPGVNIPKKRLKAPGYQTLKPEPPKKDAISVILGLIEAAGGKTELEDLRQKALEKGLLQEKFDQTLEKLREAGKIYSPIPGEIKMVH